jgi:hypothetical protein
MQKIEEKIELNIEISRPAGRERRNVLFFKGLSGRVNVIEDHIADIGLSSSPL